MRVREAMAKTFSTAQRSDPVEKVAELMVKEDCGFVPVMDADRIAGVITDRDIVVHCLGKGHHDLMSRAAEHVMSTTVTTIGPNETLEEAGHKMAQFHIRRLPVTENGKLVGILSHGNLVQALHGAGAAVGTTLGVTSGA
jgi:CBS domain-containing protein